MSYAPKYNSATRIIAQIDAINAISQPNVTLSAWVSVFRISADDIELPYLVSQKLNLIFEELALLEKTLIDEGHADPITYRTGLVTARSAFSPLHLNASVSTVQTMLQVNTKIQFQTMSAMLREQDYLASDDEMQEMHQLINDLQELVAASNLSQTLISMIRAHIELLRRALMDYPISGPRALRDAVAKARPDLFEIRQEIMDNLECKEVTALEKLWLKVMQISGPVGAVNDLVGFAQLAQGGAILAISTVLGA